jgi:hypothetical protein
MSFSINKSRGQPIATFRCQLSVWANAPIKTDLETTNNNVGQHIVVYAGVGENSNTNLPRLFTGYVTGITQDPHWDDSRKYLLNVSGEDEFALMKYGSKFTRRFKMGDDAYAAITGGKRREGGRMTKLRRMAAGKTGVTFHSAGRNASLEHSPLIKTPDPQGSTSPSPPATTGGTSVKADEPKTSVTATPAHSYVVAGAVTDVKFTDKDGNPIDLKTLQNTAGVKCLFCSSPPPSSFSPSGDQGGTKPAGLQDGVKTYPVSVTYTTNAKGESIARFKQTGSYPAAVTFVHPITGDTATINFHQVPPHDHRDIPRGGPAVGSFDSFQV